jgi:thiopeptide-type bacteriocin biosynthesis protein
LTSRWKASASAIDGGIRDTLDLVLLSLGVDDLSVLCQGRAISPEELARLREAFIEAGVARVQEISLSRCWLQAGLQFDPFGLQWSLFVSGDLQDRVRRWMAQGIVEQFSFVHKPPGVRLRLLGERVRLLPVLAEMLDGYVHNGELTAWSRGLYDAEPYQFGGEAGLAIAHRFFTTESLAVLAYHRLRLRGEASLDMVSFSLLLIDLLLREVVAEKWERWDVWRKMSLAGRAFADAQATQRQQPAGEQLVQFLEQPDRCLSEGERRIVEEYRAALPAIASDLTKANDTAALLWPMREILPFWIVFHWNRMAFDLDEQRLMTFLMDTVLSPHR